jgi:signal transduction histidine kinase
MLRRLSQLGGYDLPHTAQVHTIPSSMNNQRSSQTTATPTQGIFNSKVMEGELYDDSGFSSPSSDHGAIDTNTHPDAIKLHNARNLVTHLNCLLEDLRDSHRQMSTKSIRQLALLLKNSANETPENEPIGRHLDWLIESIDLERKKHGQSLVALSDTLRDLTQTMSADCESNINDQQTSEFFVDELISEVIERCRPTLSCGEITIQSSGVSRTKIVSNRNLLQQVLINLITNSQQALRNSEIDPKRITIRFSVRDGWTKLSVEDNGCGIPPQIQQSIVDLGYTTKHDGSGLGLTFCEQTMHRLHGYLEIASDGLNQGAMVTLHLPSTDLS